MLHFRNCHFGFQLNPVFKVQDLFLERGKFVTLFGRNGSGKTTFFKTLMQHIPLQKGLIEIGNNDFKEIDIHKSIAFVESKFDGVQHLNVQSYLELGRLPYQNFWGRISEQDKKDISYFAEQLQITHLLHKETLELSDGERQLCAIAKSLIQGCPIICLDEPTAFLDYFHKENVLKLLKKISNEFNKLIIQSSHDLDLSLMYSDSFLVVDIKKNELLEIGVVGMKKEEILKTAFYY